MVNTSPVTGIAPSFPILQLIDFGLKVLSSSYTSSAPSNNKNSDRTVILREVVDNFFRLIAEIDDQPKPTSNREKSGSHKRDEAENGLLKVGDLLKQAIGLLIDAILQVQGRDPKDASVLWAPRVAVSTIWKEKEIVNLERKMNSLRNEVDTILLGALRHKFENLKDIDLPFFAMGDFRAHRRSQWENEAMDLIQSNDWKPKVKIDLEEFSLVVDAIVPAEHEASFCNGIFQNLRFDEQDDRFYSINSPYADSFEWIFHMPYQGSFQQWLGASNGENLFWITGRPGCGKSTLMKYLFRNERLFPCLERWSGQAPGILTGCFLWNCGSNDLQRTAIGLLRTLVYEVLQDLIYGPLEEEPEIMRTLFADRWEQFIAHGGGLHPFDLQELRQAFYLLISDTSKKFLFMIDGVDETEDDPTELLQIIQKAVRHENVKICVSSCSAPVFQTIWSNTPYFKVHRWTWEGILKYVLNEFDRNEVMFSIPKENSNGTEERAIVNRLVDKASGVYLWAVLATQFLIQTTESQDNVKTIQSRVDMLPSDLDDLLWHIVGSLNEKEFQNMAKLLRLTESNRDSRLINLSYAAESNAGTSINTETRPLTPSKLLGRAEAMRNDLKIQCRSLLFVYESVSEQNDETEAADLSHFKVKYAHRSILDFILQEPMRSRICSEAGGSDFNPDERWAHAHLWTLKTLPPRSKNKSLWDAVADCIEYALRLEACSGPVRLTYLDAVGKALDHHLTRKPSATMHLPSGGVLQSFLDIAVWANLVGYITIKARTADKKQLQHALKHSKEVGKRLGPAGAGLWFKNRTCLAKAHARESQDLNILLEYYTKTVRFGSPRLLPDMPEWV